LGLEALRSLQRDRLHRNKQADAMGEKIMFDWFSWFMGLLNGVVSGAISGVILLYFILPRMASKSARQTLEEMKKDGELKPIIDKAKEIITRLEPVTKKLADAFKNLDLDKIQEGIQPYIELGKKIDPQDIDALLKQLKELSGTVQKAIEKPKKIPKPT
jgi:hypothetical protein